MQTGGVSTVEATQDIVKEMDDVLYLSGCSDSHPAHCPSQSSHYSWL